MLACRRNLRSRERNLTYRMKVRRMLSAVEVITVVPSGEKVVDFK